MDVLTDSRAILSAMTIPEYFVDHKTPWCEWVGTGRWLAKARVFIGRKPYGVVAYSHVEIEDKYPGFVSALNALWELGCDNTSVTHVLKFCIIQANGSDVHRFLVRSNTIKKVEVALAIGLSGEELTRLLMDDIQVSAATDLPGNFGYIPGS